MTQINLMRTDKAMPENLDAASEFLFSVFDGFNREDRAAWRRFWGRLRDMEPGEMALIEAKLPRSGPFHRRHMKIEQTVFDAQERFQSFRAFRDWLKIGSGHCQWVPGPRGAIIPIPDSTSYAAMDDEAFRVFHEGAIKFLRGDRAADVLWPHLKGDRAAEMMDSILEGFDE